MLNTETGEVNPLDAGRLTEDQDELRLYIIVRRDIGDWMSKAKFGVQCAHAALTTWAMCLERDQSRAWQYLMNSQAKIVLQVETEDQLRKLHAQAREAGYDAALITDAGRTEFDQPTTTAIAIGPIWFKAEGKLVKRLRLYKDAAPDAPA